MPAARTRTGGTQRLTVAVTGPTGDIGRSLLRALDRATDVREIRAMARRPFDPAEHGLRKTVYRQADVLDRAAVDEFVAGADVVVHLAFLIIGGRGETERINLEGSRNVFEASVAARAKRLVYASSVAAYGFHDDSPPLLSEDLPLAGPTAITTPLRRLRSRASWTRSSPERRPTPTFFVPASWPAAKRWRCSRTSPTSSSPTGSPARSCARSS